MRNAALSCLRRGAWIALGALLSCGVFELALRGIEATPLWQVLPVAQANLYAPDPLVGYALRANAKGLWTTENRVPITINDQGLRNPPLAERTGSLPRVYALGDSIIEALQVPQAETFTVLVSQQLKAEGRIDSVVNFGLSGASYPTQLWRYISKITLPELRPRVGDVVIFNQDFQDFLSPTTAGTGEYVGYNIPTGAAADAPIEVSRPFLQSRAFQIRSSPLGQMIYSVMNHSRLALVLNQRKNVGLLAELAKPAPPPPGSFASGILPSLRSSGLSGSRPALAHRPGRTLEPTRAPPGCLTERHSTAHQLTKSTHSGGGAELIWRLPGHGGARRWGPMGEHPQRP